MLARELLVLDEENRYTLFFGGEIHPEFWELEERFRGVVIPVREEVISKQLFMAMYCNTDGLDLIHFPALPPPAACFRPFLWTLHDATPWLYPETMDLKGRLYYRWIGGHAARSSRLLITDSENAKQEIRQALGLPDHKVKVVHLGLDAAFRRLVDLELFDAVRARYRLPERFILAVGTLEPRKNLPALIQAYRRMRREDETKLGLVIAGRPGWKTTHLQDDLEDKDGQIVLTGFVPQRDLVALYNMAEFFVMPSLYEGFGFPPLEAMACGCPVIASNRGSLPEVVGDAAMLIDPKSQDSIIAAIRAVEANQALREDLARRGLERVKEFSWKTAAVKTLELYQEVGAGLESVVR